MATEALVKEQTAEVHVEEVKLTNDVKDIDKGSYPQSKDLEGTDDEKIEVEDSTGAAAALATELKTAVVSEENQDDNMSETAVVEVEKEDAELEMASDPSTGAAVENEELSKQELESSTTEPKEEAESAALEEAVNADGKEPKSQREVTDTAVLPQSSTETSTDTSESSLQEIESETAKEPAVPEVAPGEVNATQEAAPEEANTTPETSAEEANTTPEAAHVEVNTTEEFPQVSSVSVTESNDADPTVVSPVTEPGHDDITIHGLSDTSETSKGETIKLEENKESEKEETLAPDSGKLEISDSVPDAVVPQCADAVAAEAAPVKELIEEGEEEAVTGEVSNAPQLAEGEENASANAEESVPLDANPVSETVESFAKPDITVEEMQVKPGVDEARSDTANTNSVPEVASEGKKSSECVDEKEDVSLEGENDALVETSRCIGVGEGKSDVNTEADSLVSEKTEKDEEKTLAESAEDAGEAPKADVITKSSQRQSNTIFSKVKQSIVKVKKAIIGKSPSSKTIFAEGKEEVKVKSNTEESGV